MQLLWKCFLVLIRKKTSNLWTKSRAGIKTLLVSVSTSSKDNAFFANSHILWVCAFCKGSNILFTYFPKRKTL